MLSGLEREAVRVAEEGLALVQRGATRRARLQRVHLLTTLGTCRFILAEFAAGEETLAASALMALDLRDPVGACRAYHNVAFGVDDLSDMAAYADAGLAVARDNFLRPYERSFLIALSACATEHGEFGRAEALCDAADGVTGPWIGLAHTRLDVGLPRALLALARGEIDDAREELSAVLERLRTAHEIGEWAAQRALALALLAAGETRAARDALAPALERYDAGDNYARILALPIAVEVAAADGSDGEARSLADELVRIAPDHPRTSFAQALGGRLPRVGRRRRGDRGCGRGARGGRAARRGGAVAAGRRPGHRGQGRGRRGRARRAGAPGVPGDGRRGLVPARRAHAPPPRRARAEPAQRIGSRRPHRAGGRGAGAHRRRPVEPGHRRPPLHQREDGRTARLQPVRQARGALPGAGGAGRAGARSHPPGLTGRRGEWGVRPMAGGHRPPSVAAMSREYGLSPSDDWDDFRSHRQRWLDGLAADSERYRLEAAPAAAAAY